MVLLVQHKYFGMAYTLALQLWHGVNKLLALLMEALAHNIRLPSMFYLIPSQYSKVNLSLGELSCWEEVDTMSAWLVLLFLGCFIMFCLKWRLHLRVYIYHKGNAWGDQYKTRAISTRLG